jgi:acetyl esterase
MVEIPPELLEFQLTLRPPGGGAALELLRAFEDFMNADPPEIVDLHVGVPIREVDGWRVTADVSVPFGEPPFPTIVYFHGGAWTMGAPRTHRRLAAELASLGLLVVNVDYRRAPKHRFPAAVEDCVDATLWARDVCTRFGGDASRILVGGDSAGANLAAAVIASRAAAGVEAALLLYGIYDFYRALPALAPLIGGADASSQLYVPAADFEAARSDPRLCPERAAVAFPPTFIAVGDCDPLVEESLALARALERASVPYRLHVASGAPHGFLQNPVLPAYAPGFAAIREFLIERGIIPTGRYEPESAAHQ